MEWKIEEAEEVERAEWVSKQASNEKCGRDDRLGLLSLDHSIFIYSFIFLHLLAL